MRLGPERGIGGILCLMAGIAIFSLQDLILKLISGGYPLHEAMVIRSLTAVPILLILVSRDGGIGTLATAGRVGMAIRGCLNSAAYISYYLALAALPLATTVTLYFTAPLFITLLSILFLSERVSALRWGALVLGFAGVVIALQPGSSLFDWAGLLAVAAGFFYGAAMVIGRALGPHETAPAMAFYSNLMFLIAGVVLSLIYGTGGRAEGMHESLAFLVRGWVTPNLPDFLMMIACGAIAAIGLTLLTQAYRLADASLLAPFEYAALFWGLVWGWLIWGDWPTPAVWVGIAILVGTGLFLFYLERPRAGTDDPKAAE